MGVLLVVMVLALTAVLAATLWWTRSTAGHTLEPVPEEPGPDEPGTTVLRYDVPDGQDPAAVVAGLAAAGLAATTTTVGAVRVLSVPLARDSVLDREDVRTLIADAAAAESVRFEDEPPGPGVPRKRPGT